MLVLLNNFRFGLLDGVVYGKNIKRRELGRLPPTPYRWDRNLQASAFHNIPSLSVRNPGHFETHLLSGKLEQNPTG